MPPKAQPIALRIELQIEPLVWRRIVVSNQWTFGALHNYLQWAGRIRVRTSFASANAASSRLVDLRDRT